MASSPAPHSMPASVVLADVVSYGYAVVIAAATLTLDLEFALWQAIVIASLFVVLRGIAREMRRDATRAIHADARRRAAVRAQSPTRWSAEQRDGLGRRVDTGA